MKLYQWTVFLDMLGFREFINVDDEQKAKEAINFLKENKKIFEFHENDLSLKKKYSKTLFNLYDYYDIQFAFISDSIIINFYPKEVEENKILKDFHHYGLKIDINDSNDIYYRHSANILYIICFRITKLMFNMLSKNIFIRGGISNKFSLVEDEFVVGNGIVEAYNIESKISKYPRIVLGDDIVNDKKLMQEMKFLSKLLYNRNYIVTKDNDGYFFLNYLNAKLGQLDYKSINPEGKYMLGEVLVFLTLHKKAILKNVKSIKNSNKDPEKKEKILKKYYWLIKYHKSPSDKLCKP